MPVNQTLHEQLEYDIGQSPVGKKCEPIQVSPGQDKVCLFQDRKSPIKKWQPVADWSPYRMVSYDTFNTNLCC